MSEDPAHPWGSGATHYRWRPDVAIVVQRILSQFPQVTVNTYVCHPWCGWSDQSLDVWGSGGRGDPLPRDIGLASRNFLMNLSGPPMIRHTIWRHQIWTAWGGYSRWVADDHSGRLRHLHVTYY